MKIFKFNPITGKRGEQIGNRKIAEWTSFGIDYGTKNGKIEPIAYSKPRDSRTQEWTAHVDAGEGDDSYLADEWICFCLGEWRAGEEAGVWTWAILPPKDAVVYI